MDGDIDAPAKSPQRGHTRGRSESWATKERVKKEPFLWAFGDSFLGTLTLFPKHAVKTRKWKGASARGLANPNSSLRLSPLVLEELDINQPRNLLLVFGQVDISINYLHQLQTRPPSSVRSPDEWVLDVYNAYSRWIGEELVAKRMVGSSEEGYIEHLWIMGAIMPIIEDDRLEEFLRKYRGKEGIAASLASDATGQGDKQKMRLLGECGPHDMATRRRMTFAYNRALAQIPTLHTDFSDRIHIMDLNRHICTKEGDGTVDPKYIDPIDPLNFHVIWEESIPFWVDELTRDGDPGGLEGLRELIKDEDQRKKGVEDWGREKRDRLERQGLQTKPERKEKEDNIWRAPAMDESSRFSFQNRHRRSTSVSSVQTSPPVSPYRPPHRANAGFSSSQSTSASSNGATRFRPRNPAVEMDTTSPPFGLDKLKALLPTDSKSPPSSPSKPAATSSFFSTFNAPPPAPSSAYRRPHGRTWSVDSTSTPIPLRQEWNAKGFSAAGGRRRTDTESDWRRPGA
ncbi:hypothetical protein BT69DRAFT_677011 [Atractiella rhizophila]|nr:hypothetical protein BT69DRAFT_677011 [Atractiella rhizophila]